MQKILAITIPALLLSACGGGGLADRKRPDEFAVGKQAPLVIPPDFALTPPRPGAPRPLASDNQQQALDALFGAGVQVPPRSEIENSLLNDAGAIQNDPGVRSTVDDAPGPDATATVDKGVFLRELLDAKAGTRNAEIARVTIPGGPATQETGQP